MGQEPIEVVKIGNYKIQKPSLHFIWRVLEAMTSSSFLQTPLAFLRAFHCSIPCGQNLNDQLFVSYTHNGEIAHNQWF
jgi:hypothetical protein